MRTKSIVKESKDFKKAVHEVTKEDDLKTIYVKVSGSLFDKLKVELAKKRLTMAKWVSEKIKEIK